MTKHFESLERKLKRGGWKFAESSLGDYWWKPLPTKRACEENGLNPPSMTIKLYRITEMGEHPPWLTADVDVRGELDGEWYSFRCYSINPKDWNEKKIVARLVRAWEAA